MKKTWTKYLELVDLELKRFNGPQMPQYILNTWWQNTNCTEVDPVKAVIFEKEQCALYMEAFAKAKFNVSRMRNSIRIRKGEIITFESGRVYLIDPKTGGFVLDVLGRPKLFDEFKFACLEEPLKQPKGLKDFEFLPGWSPEEQFEATIAPYIRKFNGRWDINL